MFGIGGKKQNSETEDLQLRANIEHICDYLKQNSAFKQIVESIVTTTLTKHETKKEVQIVEKRVEVPVDRIVEKKVEVTPNWAKKLEPEFDFLNAVKKESNLHSILLPSGQDDLLQLIVNAAQWKNIVRMWEQLSIQVKKNESPITGNQSMILSHSIHLYKLTDPECKVALIVPQIGEYFDFNEHQRLNNTGEQIASVLLPGLQNASGEMINLAIIISN